MSLLFFSPTFLVHGNWSEWADWLDCSKSCGGGYMKRARTCTSPEPEHGGQPCQGKSFQTKTCNDVVCPGRTFPF